MRLNRFGSISVIYRSERSYNHRLNRRVWDFNNIVHMALNHFLFINHQAVGYVIVDLYLISAFCPPIKFAWYENKNPSFR